MDGLARLSHCNTLLRNRCSASSLLHSLRCYNKTHYEVLGVGNTCSTKEIREAYMSLSKKLHPDVSPGSHREFVALNEAYQTLSRRQTRSLYDASLLRAPSAAADDGRAWRRHGDMETTAPHDRVFWDETIWGMRDKSGDYKFQDKPYYGIKGLKRLSNGPVAIFCLIFMILGIIVHVVAIRSSHQMATTYIDEKNRRLFEVYTSAREKAIDPKDKEKIERFLKSLKADAVD